MSNVNFIWSSCYSAKRGMVENKSVISFNDSFWEVLICTERTLVPMWPQTQAVFSTRRRGRPIFFPVMERNSSNHWEEAEYRIFLHSTLQCPRLQRICKVAILYFHLKSELKRAVGIEVRWDACLFSESDACIPTLSQNSLLKRFQLCVPLILYQAALSQARKVPWKGSYDTVI